jgi:hypothetical protein
VPSISEWVPLPAPLSGAAGIGDLLLEILASVDRLCGQFATALHGAEHEHLFLIAALLGTLTLVLPSAR